MEELIRNLEAILFYKAEPVSKKQLVKILGSKESEITEAITKLKDSLKDRGVVLQEHQGKYVLATHPQVSELIENMRKEELNKNLSKAALEALSIILYKGDAHRAYIDYVRGVNSSFILRILMIRGLIEREQDPEDSRRYIYKPTFELLGLLGIEKVEDMPNFIEVSNSLDASYKASQEIHTKDEERGIN